MFRCLNKQYHSPAQYLFTRKANYSECKSNVSRLKILFPDQNTIKNISLLKLSNFFK